MKRQTYSAIESDLAPFEKSELDAQVLSRWLDQRRPCTLSVFCFGENGVLVQLGFAGLQETHQRGATEEFALERAVRACIRAREHFEACGNDDDDPDQ